MKSKYKYYFMRLEHGTFHIVKIRTLREPKELIGFKDKQFKIDLSNPLYINRNKAVICYFIDMDSGNQLTFNQIESKANPEDLDIIVGQSIIKELTKGISTNKMDILKYIVVGLLFGGLVVGLIMNIYYSGKITDIYADYGNSAKNDNSTIIIPTSLTLSIIKTIGWMFL